MLPILMNLLDSSMLLDNSSRGKGNHFLIFLKTRGMGLRVNKPDRLGDELLLLWKLSKVISIPSLKNMTQPTSKCLLFLPGNDTA
jgi:hypothetical protein